MTQQNKPFITGMALGPGRSLELDWSDGHHSSFPPRYLRERCRCAGCVHEWTGAPLLDPATIPLNIVPAEVAPVGNYALQITWSDGHNAGIFSFEQLRKICPCCQEQA